MSDRKDQSGHLFEGLDGLENPLRSTRDERFQRLAKGSEATTHDDPETVLFHHTVMCQTGLPYRNPGDQVRQWERANGGARLKIMAGEAMHPESQEFVPIGLPYGPKPRLILAHLNGEALRQGSPEIEVDDSLTGFVKRLRLDAGGRTIGTIKDQLGRLSASTIRLGMVREGHAITINTGIVTAFDLWFPKMESQRVLWPSTVKLSADYFSSLVKNAVPLHDEALAALSGSAMALDVYAWLAGRLHRIGREQRVFVPWAALKDQFGWHYDRMDNFKPVFRRTLKLVHSQYRGASIDMDGNKGLVLRHSPTPVKSRWWPVARLP